MRKGLIKTVVLVVAAIATIAVMGLLDHHSGFDLTSEMAPATLPVVYLQRDNVKINELYGYSSEMDGTAMRDTITPLQEGLTLPVVVKTYENQIEGLSYEVRSMDMQRLIENGDADLVSEENGEVHAKLKFENILEEDQEYVLVIIVNSGGKDVYYYTRMMREKEYFVKESLDFVMDFHEKTFDKARSGELATYLEPNNQADNTTLQ